jgi:hypothetical protein
MIFYHLGKEYDVYNEPTEKTLKLMSNLQLHAVDDGEPFSWPDAIKEDFDKSRKWLLAWAKAHHDYQKIPWWKRIFTKFPELPL